MDFVFNETLYHIGGQLLLLRSPKFYATKTLFDGVVILYRDPL